MERPRTAELAREQFDARRLRQRRVVVDDASPLQQLADDGLVDVAVLPQVEGREVEAEHVDGAAATDRVAAPRADARRAMRATRRSCPVPR
jgi:hypothetical protein